MVVRDAKAPEPRDGEAVLTVRYCGICGSDLSLFKSGIMSGPDVVLGHEISAVVEKDPTERFSPGDRVVAWPIRGCGDCLWCLEGRPQYCLNSSLEFGGYAEKIVYPVSNLLGIPEGMDDQSASLTEPLGVAVRAVWEAAVEEEDLVFVSGLGAIGLLVVSALRDAGARVIGADVREDRRTLGDRFGCELVFDPVAEDPWWKTLTVDPHGPAFAFECAGVPQALQTAINVCGHAGTVVLLGIPFEPAFIIPAVMSVKEQRMFSISGSTRESMAASLALLERRPEIANLVTGTVPLGETERAMHDLVEGHGGVKVLVEAGA